MNEMENSKIDFKWFCRYLISMSANEAYDIVKTTGSLLKQTYLPTNFPQEEKDCFQIYSSYGLFVEFTFAPENAIPHLKYPKHIFVYRDINSTISNKYRLK